MAMEVRGCSSSADGSPSPFDSLPLIEEVRRLPGPVRRDLIRIALLTSDSLRRHGHPDSACIDKFCGVLEAAEDFSKKINGVVEAQRLASRPKRPREEHEEEGWKISVGSKRISESRLLILSTVHLLLLKL